MLPLALVALAGLVAAAFQLTKGPDLSRVAAGLRLPLLYVQTASKWSKRRGLPLEWVLATILVESGGNAQARGDSDARSVGLMQVNVVAHADELRAAGVSLAQMMTPETNIEWGTKYIAAFRDQVLAALGGHQPPAPIDVLLRLAYKGPAAVTSALRRGQNPVQTLSWAPEAVARWRDAMGRVSALTQGALRA